MNTDDINIDAVITSLDEERSIAVKPATVRALDGDLVMAALLQQLRYRERHDRHVERWTDDEGEWVCATRAELAEDLGLSPSQVWRVLQRSIEQGFVRSCQPHKSKHDRRVFVRFVTSSARIRDIRARDSVTSERAISRALPLEVEEHNEKNTHTPELALVQSPSIEPMAWFDDFWKSYPRRNGAKVGKAAASKQWAKLKSNERAEALAGLPAYAAAKGAYPEDAERYLKHRRWVGLEVDTPGDRDARVMAKAEQIAQEMGMR